MNYGKLAYNALTDTTNRLLYLESMQSIQYSSLGFTESIPAVDSFNTKFLYFTLQKTTSILVDVFLVTTDSVKATINFELKVDGLIVNESYVEIYGNESSKQIKINLNSVSKGAHFMCINFTEGASILKSVNLTCYASGMAKTSKVENVNGTTNNELTLFSSLIPTGANISAIDGVVYYNFSDVSHMDLAFLNAYTIGVVRVDTEKNLYFMIININENNVVCETLIDKNVSTCSVAMLNSFAKGVLAYIKNGKIYVSYLHTDEYVNTLPYYVATNTTTPISLSLIKNSIDYPIILFRANNDICYALKLRNFLSVEYKEVNCNFDVKYD